MKTQQVINKTFPSLTDIELTLLKQTCLISEFPGKYGFLKKPTIEQAQYHFSEAKERTAKLLDSLAHLDDQKVNIITFDYVTIDMDLDDDEEDTYDEVLVKFNGTTVGVFSEVTDEHNNDLYRGAFMFFPIGSKSLYSIEKLFRSLLEVIDSNSQWKVIG
jgi:hypothetical protein